MKYSLNGHRHGHQKTAKPKGSGPGQKRGLATRYWPRNITPDKGGSTQQMDALLRKITKDD